MPLVDPRPSSSTVAVPIPVPAAANTLTRLLRSLTTGDEVRVPLRAAAIIEFEVNEFVLIATEIRGNDDDADDDDDSVDNDGGGTETLLFELCNDNNDDEDDDADDDKVEEKDDNWEELVALRFCADILFVKVRKLGPTCKPIEVVLALALFLMLPLPGLLLLLVQLLSLPLDEFNRKARRCARVCLSASFDKAAFNTLANSGEEAAILLTLLSISLSLLDLLLSSLWRLSPTSSSLSSLYCCCC